MKILSALMLGMICMIGHAQEKDILKTRVLDSSAMLADFRYLRQLLQETHPGLYRYTSKEAMQKELDSSEALLHTSMPFYNFYSIIEALIADIHCAHTYSLPVKNIESYLNSSMKTIPFYLFPIGNKIYVLFNCTADQTILPGFELLSVNGRNTEDIKNTIARYYWADGFIQSSKNQVLQGQLFDIFYYSFIERPDSFHLAFKNFSGDTVQFDAPAQVFGSFIKFIADNPVNKQMNAWYNQKNKQSWRLSFPKDVAATAVLRFDGFSGEGAKTEEEAGARFRIFMDKSLAEMERKKCTNLIVDVRSNNGGWDIQGVELFTYLMKNDTAVKYYRRQHAITERSDFLKYSDLSPEELKTVEQGLIPEPDGTFTLKEEKNSTLQLQYPKPNRFKGKVYILMDEKTFSTAAEFTAAAHANKAGLFIGEESGGCYDGGNGGSFIHLELPNSKIAVGTPLVYYQMNVNDAGQKGRGTLPDYVVLPSLIDVLNHTDSQLNFVKSLIRK